ncbi:hypothetical protein [Pseudoalteromonas sp. MMG024]|uniref:hypothetical protein n=1 Tax=Pseudoalteromonas sp. MMG024 TaxID=2909980 RepID=UPI001F33AF9B|nr:hypothetical protein [Pseudoalteromonas sp. MMG024]MCF6455668.1 hypothetical protein [Pseudoalteromonas sp. MMG024]
MDIQDIKLLADIGVLGSNSGLTREAEHIFAALRLSKSGEQIAVTTTALNLFNRARFPEAAQTLSKWCENKTPSIPHALLAMVYWTWGFNVNAEAYARDVLSQASEPEAHALAKEVLDGMGVTY